MADECGFVYMVCSADHYFYKGNGRYVFNPHELSDAHSTSQQKAQLAMVQKTQLVIIDNTNLAVSPKNDIFSRATTKTSFVLLRTGK